MLQTPIYAVAAWLVLARPNAAAISGRAAVAGILLVGLAMRLIVLPSPPASNDIYRYVWDGRVQAAGINPYRYLPADEALRPLRDEAIYPHINRATYAPTIYPPAAQLVFLAATRISETAGLHEDRHARVRGAGGMGDPAIAGRARPARHARLLYAWHPLPLWQFAGDGHVDAIAIAFLLLAFVAADRRSPILSGIALAAGVLVKYFPAVAGPAIYKRWDWRLPAAFAASLGLLYLPYLGVGTKVFGFLGGYVAEEGFEQGSGIFLWQLAGTHPPAAAERLLVLLSAGRRRHGGAGAGRPVSAVGAEGRSRRRHAARGRLHGFVLAALSLVFHLADPVRVHSSARRACSI